MGEMLLIGKASGGSAILDDDIVFYGEEDSDPASPSYNADTLGGYLPEHYAKASDLNDIELGITMVKLWENASPTSEFVEQTISLDLSEFDMVEIFYKRASSANEWHSAKIKVGTYGSLFAMTNYRSQRTVTVNTTGIVFAAGRQANISESLTENNVAAVPVAIYGIKGVS